MRDLLTGDWGHTFPGAVRARAFVGPRVMDVIRPALPISARIVLPVLLIQVLAGVAAGAASTRWRDRPAGTGIYVAAIVLIGIPILALAQGMQSLFGWHLNWLPVRGVHAGWIAYAMPVGTLALASTAFVTLLNALSSDSRSAA